MPRRITTANVRPFVVPRSVCPQGNLKGLGADQVSIDCILNGENKRAFMVAIEVNL